MHEGLPAGPGLAPDVFQEAVGEVALLPVERQESLGDPVDRMVVIGRGGRAADRRSLARLGLGRDHDGPAGARGQRHDFPLIRTLGHVDRLAALGYVQGVGRVHLGLEEVALDLLASGGIKEVYLIIARFVAVGLGVLGMIIVLPPMGYLDPLPGRAPLGLSGFVLARRLPRPGLGSGRDQGLTGEIRRFGGGVLYLVALLRLPGDIFTRSVLLGSSRQPALGQGLAVGLQVELGLPVGAVLIRLVFRLRVEEDRGPFARRGVRVLYDGELGPPLARIRESGPRRRRLDETLQ